MAVQQFKGIWELVSSIIKWGSLLIGGVCILANSALIGQFPEDMDLGEGVALYFLSIGFVLAYALYWLALTSIGLCLLRWPMEFLRFLSHRAPTHAAAYLPADYKAMWAFPIWPIALLSLAVSAVLFRFQPLDSIKYGSIVVLQGFLGGVLLLIRRKLRFEETGLSLTGAAGKKAGDTPGLRQAGYLLLAFWLLGPLLIGQNQGNFIDAAFRGAQLRKDHATVHVAAPWDVRLTEEGLIKGASFLGSQYARFDNVTVRLRSIGSRVVIEVPSAKGKSKYIGIPRASIEVE